jgi:iron-sulfur cluster assembly protein
MKITERAANEIKRLAAKRGRPDDWVVIGLIGGGCNGYQYFVTWQPPAIAFVNQDHLFEEHGVKVFVDHKSYIYLKGLTFDFETGIRGHGFKINNPNIKSECGCKKSVGF